METSVQFWTDPRMSDKTVQSKEQFLEQKGLTRREIDEVRKRARLANPPPMPPNPAFPGDTGNGAGRANISGANIQYIPIPIPTAPGQNMSAPTFLQRIGGWLQVIGTGMAAVAGASYVYHQYQNHQFHTQRAWGQLMPQQTPQLPGALRGFPNLLNWRQLHHHLQVKLQAQRWYRQPQALSPRAMPQQTPGTTKQVWC